MEISGQSVVLTGASGGLGRAIARALHRRGASLVLSGRRVQALEALRAELGDRAEVFPADLARADEVTALAGRAVEAGVLVANAGLPASGRLTDLSPEDVDRALAVNLRAPIHLAQAVVPAMVERGEGHLVFISSMAGKVASGRSAVYSATKFGLRGFAFSLREDLLGTGVGVTTVFPGFVRGAGMWADAGVGLPKGVGTSTPDEVAAAVVRGIESGPAEIDVAPPIVRVGGLLAAVSPTVLANVTRRFGGDRVGRELSEAQRDKR